MLSKFIRDQSSRLVEVSIPYSKPRPPFNDNWNVPLVITPGLKRGGSVRVRNCLTAKSWNSCTVPDRKSTRLNSSHGYISYAVFCLKKKKTKHSAQQTQRWAVVRIQHQLV